MIKISKELAKGGLVLFISFNFFNFLNLVFNFAGARLLGPSDYGILASLMGVIFIFSIPNEAIQTIVSRYSTKAYIQKENGKIKDILIKSLVKLGILSIIIFLIFAAISPIISRFLSISNMLIIFTGLFIFGAFFMPITRGIFQGTKRFNALGASYITESSIKLILSVLFILIGWRVYGAILGVIFGILFSFGLSLISLKEVIKEKRKKEKTQDIYSYSFPALVSIGVVMVFFSLDIILAKAFFSEEIVGLYAAISNLGKVIFLGTWGISRAMFPLASEKHDKKDSSKHLLEQTILIVFFISCIIIAVYFMLSKQIISILYGKEYIAISSLLIYPSLAMGILSLTNVFIVYNLSVNRGKRNYISILFVVIEIILLSMFHANLIQFLISLIISNILFFTAVFCRYFLDS